LSDQNQIVELDTKDTKTGGLRTPKDTGEKVEKNTLTLDKFAELISRDERTARRICKKAYEDGHYRWKWNGEQVELKVQKKAGNVGQGGFLYIVVAKSLPMELQRKWYAQFIKPIKVPVREEVKTNARIFHRNEKQADKRLTQDQFRRTLLKEVLAAPKGSALRAQLIREMDGRSVFNPVKNQEITLKANTIKSSWIPKLENEDRGYNKPRNDAGKKRVYISQKWHKAMNGFMSQQMEITEQDLQNIEEFITRFIRGSLAKGAGIALTTRLAMEELAFKTIELLEKAGLPLTYEQVAWNQKQKTGFCYISKTPATTEKNNGYGVIHLADHNAKTFYDLHQSNVLRHREGLEPNQIVVADVHPIDVPFRMKAIVKGIAKEVIRFPQAIAWQCLATNRLYIDIVFTEQGRGVRQIDVINSYMNLVEQWGLVFGLYLDNGTEYQNQAWIKGIQNLKELTQLQINVTGNVPPEYTEEHKTVVRALAYNAKAKPIEGLFSVLEQAYFAMMPEHVGGDRTKMKLTKLGGKPLAINSKEEYVKRINEQLYVYHADDQQGSLNGSSPADKMQQFIDDGWGKYEIDRDAMQMAFSKEETRIVGSTGAGRFIINNIPYHDVRFERHTGMTLKVLIPIDTDAFIWAFQPNSEEPIQIYQERKYGFTEEEGYKESARRKAAGKAIIEEMRTHCAEVNIEQKRVERAKRQPQMPNSPVKGKIELTKEQQKALEQDVQRIAQEKFKPSEEQTRYGSTSDLKPKIQITYEDDDDE